MDRSITAPGTRPGAWHWLLLLLLLAERGLALFAFPVDESLWLAAGWERPFLWTWGLGLGLTAGVLLVLRRRAGGWLAAVSGLALAARACVPMLGEGRTAEQQVYGAVFALMVASATLTFAFLHEQSWWAVAEVKPEPDQPNRIGPETP